MTMDLEVIYAVVINHEEMYSIWRVGRNYPTGWWEAGYTGTKEACLDWIQARWTDQRPLSLRDKMAENAKIGT